MGHAAQMGEMRNPYNILVWRPKRKRSLEDLGVDGKTILKLILQK